MLSAWDHLKNKNKDFKVEIEIKKIVFSLYVCPLCLSRFFSFQNPNQY